MALPLPVLDDRTFEEMTAEALRLVPQRAPAWTDHNLSDPGVTLIELFTWLTEMQRFYLDRLRDESYVKLLGLLGMQPRAATPARAGVAVSMPESAPMLAMPRGTPLRLGGVAFETAQSTTLVPAQLAQIVTSSRAGQVDETSANDGDGLSFFAFGPEAEEGSRLYLGFDKALPAEVDLALDLILYEGYPVARGAHGDEPPQIEPSALVEWEAFADGDWLPLEILDDESRMLSLPGRLRFRIPQPMQASELPPVAASRYWLRATVVEPGFELPPRLTAVRWRTVPAVEGETLCEALELALEDRRIIPVPDPSYLVLHGEHQVQVQGSAGFWRDLDGDPVKTDGGGGGVRIDLGREPTAAERTVRLISFPAGFRRRLLLGGGSGLPNQSFRLEETPVAELRLQVLEADGRRWRDWQRVDDLAASGAASPCFQLDPETGEVRFGDGRQGLPLPAAENENLRILALRVGGGLRGNVAANLKERPLSEGDGLLFTLPAAASGGTDRETLEDARVRLRQDLLTPWRAVTDLDFEALAKATPGLRVARAWSLPLLAPGAETSQTPAAVTVIVVPFSESPKPVPSPGFLRTVRCHLDRHRLLTTRLHVAGPDYVRVGIAAGLILLPGAGQEAVRARAGAALDRFLHPLQGGPAGEGWSFGRPVYLSEVYEVLERVPGVDSVERVSLAAEGEGVARDARGSVLIPPRSLVYAGDHLLDFLQREGLGPVRRPS
jgi:hypothetical protein